MTIFNIWWRQLMRPRQFNSLKGLSKLFSNKKVIADILSTNPSLRTYTNQHQSENVQFPSRNMHQSQPPNAQPPNVKTQPVNRSAQSSNGNAQSTSGTNTLNANILQMESAGEGIFQKQECPPPPPVCCEPCCIECCPRKRLTCPPQICPIPPCPPKPPPCCVYPPDCPEEPRPLPPHCINPKPRCLKCYRKFWEH